MNIKWYGKGLLACMKNDVDLETATIKLQLHTSVYVPDLDLHDFADDLTGEVANGNGYVTGGVTLAGKALTYDAATNQVRFDHTDPSWTFTASKTWRYGVLRNVRGGLASADEIVILIDWLTDQTSSTLFTANLDARGLIGIDTT